MSRRRLPIKLVHHCSKLAGAAMLVFSIALAGHAQAGGAGVDFGGSGGADSINGRIYFPSGRRSDAQIKVSLESSNAGTRVVFADHNGSFSFRNLEPGRYTVIVDSGKEYETLTESIYIDDMRSRSGGPSPPPRAYNLPIYLQPKRTSSDSTGSGIVDARMSGVPARARTLYQKALESEKSGDISRAIEQLNEAIKLYPTFVLALNELGVQYLKQAKLDRAIESLTAAIKLAPDEFSPRLNYGIALLNQRKFADAEIELRAALKMNDTVPTAHMYLGMALGAQRKLMEAEKELLIAVNSKSPETARAHRYLGGIYLETQDYKRAADELEIYLKLMPNTADAEQTRATIKECRRKS